MIRRPRKSPLFPHTTLFRSRLPLAVAVDALPRIVRILVLDADLELAVVPLALAALREHNAMRRRGERHDGKLDRKSTRLNSSHQIISYAVFFLKKKTTYQHY